MTTAARSIMRESRVTGSKWALLVTSTAGVSAGVIAGAQRSVTPTAVVAIAGIALLAIAVIACLRHAWQSEAYLEVIANDRPQVEVHASNRERAETRDRASHAGAISPRAREPEAATSANCGDRSAGRRSQAGCDSAVVR